MNYALSKVSLGFLLLIALAGLLLRFSPLTNIPFEYTHLKHAHSHVAFQGWIYTILFLLICKFFLTQEQIERGKYALQLKITIGIIVGIFIAFALQGYALFSILFSTCFQLMNYWFIYSIFRDLKQRFGAKKLPVSVKFIKMSLFLGILSTMGPWAIAYFSAKGMAGTEEYNSSIYFFLHFQYNGWFFFGALGVLLRMIELENKSQLLPYSNLLLIISTLVVFPSYLLSLTGMSFSSVLFFPVLLTVILQLSTPIVLYQVVKNTVFWKNLIKKPLSKLFFQLSFTCFIIKVLFLIGAILPTIGYDQFNNRFTLIFYLHLVLIGILTFFFLASMIKTSWLMDNLLLKIAIKFLLIGFVGTEALLLITGVTTHFFVLPLLILSGFLVVGIFLIFYSSLKLKNYG